MGKSMICNICQSEMIHQFTEKILSSYSVEYLRCPNCAVLQTEKPYWISEAYEDAIVDADTGLVQRNISLARKVATVIYFLFDRAGKCLDFAGGYGMFTRIMRDYGFHFYWSDPYCKNILAKGFELDDSVEPIAVLTAFEVMEHVHEPIQFLESCMQDHQVNTIIFSTQLYEGKTPDRDWWYYVFDGGQHITFYTKETLRAIAKKLGLYFVTANGVHLYSKKPVNPLLFRLLTGPLSYFLIVFVRLRMPSLTEKDHHRLMVLQRNNGSTLN